MCCSSCGSDNDDLDPWLRINYSGLGDIRTSKNRYIARVVVHNFHIFSDLINFSMLELCHAGAHNKYESFDVWFEANGPELIELDEIFDGFAEPSNLLQ